MAVRVRLAGTLKSVAGGKGEVEAAGGSLKAIIESLDRAFPGFGGKVLGSDGALKQSVVVHVNGTEARQLAGVDTAVAETDEVLISIPLAGG